MAIRGAQPGRPSGDPQPATPVRQPKDQGIWRRELSQNATDYGLSTRPAADLLPATATAAVGLLNALGDNAFNTSVGVVSHPRRSHGMIRRHRYENQSGG